MATTSQPLANYLGIQNTMYSPVGWESMADAPNPFDPVKYPKGYNFYNTLNNYDRAAVNVYINRHKGGANYGGAYDGISGQDGILNALLGYSKWQEQNPVVNYGPSRDAAGNIIVDPFTKSMMESTTPSLLGAPVSGNPLEYLLSNAGGVILAAALPGIGAAISSELVSAGVMTAGVTADAVGLAVANTAAGLVQGQPLDKALTNAVVGAAVSTGSIEVAQQVNTIIGHPEVTNAIVSAAGSMVKTAAAGGSEDDILKAGTAGLVSSVTTSAVSNVVSASSNLANVAGAAAGGAVVGGGGGAIMSALKTIAGIAGSKIYQSAEDKEYDRLKAEDDADAAVEAAFSTVTPTGGKTAEDIEYEKQKALDDADKAVEEIFATVTVNATSLPTVTVQATPNSTQAILNLINVTPTPSVVSQVVTPTPIVTTTPTAALPTVTVTASPTVSVSPAIFTTVSPTINVTQTLVDQILNTVTVQATQPVLPTVTVQATRPTVTVTQVQVLPTVTVRATQPILPTVTIRATQAVLPTVTVRATRPTVTVTQFQVLPTVTVRATISPTVTLPTVTVRATISPTVTLPTVTVRATVSPTVTLPTVTVRATISPTIDTTPTVTASPTVKYSPTIKIFTTVTPPSPSPPLPPKKPTSVLAQALNLQPTGAYRGAGEIEDPSTGKKRRKVWNEETLRLKDALGV